MECGSVVIVVMNNINQVSQILCLYFFQAASLIEASYGSLQLSPLWYFLILVVKHFLLFLNHLLQLAVGSLAMVMIFILMICKCAWHHILLECESTIHEFLVSKKLAL